MGRGSLADFYNYAFRLGTSDYLIKVDAHCIYSLRGIERIQKKIEQGCDIIHYRGVEFFGKCLSIEAYCFRRTLEWEFFDKAHWEILAFATPQAKRGFVLFPPFLHMKRLGYVKSVSWQNYHRVAGLKKRKIISLSIRRFASMLLKFAMHSSYEPLEYFNVREKGVIYLVNSKVACSSIKSAFFQQGPEVSKNPDTVHYATALRSVSSVSREELNNSFIFTFVRNPFDRLVSCYVDKYLKSGEDGNAAYFDGYLFNYLGEGCDFGAFVRKIVKIPHSLADRHFKPQYLLLKACPRKVDYIGKFENLASDFEVLVAKYGCSRLPKINSTSRKEWKMYYCKVTRELVYRYYRRDFELFGYEDQYQSLGEYLASRR